MRMVMVIIRTGICPMNALVYTDCPTKTKIYGCVDSDGDGYADTDDFCPDGPEECLEAMLKGRAPPINILINLGFIVIVLFIGVGIWKHNRINRGN